MAQGPNALGGFVDTLLGAPQGGLLAAAEQRDARTSSSSSSPHVITRALIDALPAATQVRCPSADGWLARALREKHTRQGTAAGV